MHCTSTLLDFPTKFPVDTYCSIRVISRRKCGRTDIRTYGQTFGRTKQRPYDLPLGSIINVMVNCGFPSLLTKKVECEPVQILEISLQFSCVITCSNTIILTGNSWPVDVETSLVPWLFGGESGLHLCLCGEWNVLGYQTSSRQQYGVIGWMAIVKL